MQIKPRARLWAEIKKLGLNQRSFSKIVGEHESVVSRVINGTMNLPPAKASVWAKTLGQKIDYLFGE